MDPLSIRRSLESFLLEDLGYGDITSEAIFQPDQPGKAEFVAKESFVTAGMGCVASEVFRITNPSISYTSVADGHRASPGDILFSAQGPVLDLLRAERVALNLVQRLCGIASLTAEFVKLVDSLPVKIVDTRKTTPGLRVLEKYAVRVGGGHNHRFGLGDGILIKDNHIAACGSIQEAVRLVRERAPHGLKVEVESESLAQVEECLACGVEIIMLDNMDTAEMRQAVDLVHGKAILEASGGINIGNVRAVAETGVDIISIGALTHSAKACDISMRVSE